MSTRRLGEQGFTLIELIAATVIIVGGTLFALFFLLSPADFTERNTASERRAEVAYIAQGIARYARDTGELPPNIPSKPTAIGSYEDHYNLCTVLVPKYAYDLPLDPGGGLKMATRDSKGERCIDEGVKYGSGYAISKDKKGRVTIVAPLAEAEDAPAISITIDPLK
jgi:prepilin-type N-terminal cleavage/methylation domain-containing protein